MEREIRRGKPINEIVRSDDSGKLTSITLPEESSRWVGRSLPAQVEHMFQEITSRKPYGEIAGGK